MDPDFTVLKAKTWSASRIQSIISLNSCKMSEKLSLQWNDFQDNVKSAFGNLRESTDFADVTLACEDGHQIEAHKVVLAASSPFFQAILQRNKHSHPLIYMRGMKSVDLVAMVDFLYFGEANVYQENLDSFLAIAEELQLKGLQGSNDLNGFNETEVHKEPLLRVPKQKNKTDRITSDTRTTTEERTEQNEEKGVESHAPSIPMSMSADLQQLDETIKSMMETSQQMFPNGNQQQKGKQCKVCGKEGRATDIKRHIEANHLEGVSIPCNQCDKIFRSRNALRCHVSRNHEQY